MWTLRHPEISDDGIISTTQIIEADIAIMQTVIVSANGDNAKGATRSPALMPHKGASGLSFSKGGS